MGINVLSLFDGMSCGRIALERAGIKVDNYFAAEIDKYAIKVSKKNYPDIIRLGDVTQWQSWVLPKIDLILAGSPCQGFSLAGKQLAFDDPRSKLFFTFIDIATHYAHKDLKFLLENVRMKKKWQDVISKYMGCEPVKINSALVSAQNRVRNYWSNIDFDQPEDREIYLKDIVLPDVLPVCVDTVRVRQEKTARIFQDKSPTLRTPSGGGRVPSFVTEVFGNAVVRRGRGNAPTGVRADGKCLAVTSSRWEENIKLLIHSPEALEYMDRKVKDGRTHWDSKSSAIVANLFKGVPYNVFKDWDCVRKFHPVECERLQTVPDNYTEGVSNTQRYKMLGNGWTVDVIVDILSGIK